jgi:hypothetical protein
MKKDRVLLIGFDIGDFTSFDLLSDANLDEFTTIIWRPSTLLAELQQHGVPPPIPHSVVKIIERRIEQLNTWVSAGHSLVVILDDIQAIALGDESGRILSGQFYALHTNIFADVVTESSSGARIDYCGPRSFMTLLERWAPMLHYEVIVEGDRLIPLMRVSRGRPGNVQIVAGFMNVGAGHIYFIPPLAQETSDKLTNYCETLARLPDTLSGVPAELPDWTKSFRSADELTIVSTIASLEENVATLRDRISTQQVLLDEAEMLKNLFAGTGTAFTDCVSSVLRELGFKVVLGPHPRADLIAFHGKTLVTIEAKGLDGPVREFNLRQAEKWVADLHATLSASPEDRIADSDLLGYANKVAELEIEEDTADIECKGMMVIGTYRKTPLGGRTAPDFPDPVARPINRLEICVLTGLQLLGLLINAREAPDRKIRIIDLLKSTNGIISISADWTAFLQQT